jgi:NADPH:quinone reductase
VGREECSTPEFGHEGGEGHAVEAEPDRLHEQRTGQMKAVIIRELGETEVLRIVTTAIPEPGSGTGRHRCGLCWRGTLPKSSTGAAWSMYNSPLCPASRLRSGSAPEVRVLTIFTVGPPVATLTIVDSGGHAEVVVTSADLVARLDRLGIGMGVAAALPSVCSTAVCNS